MTPRPFALVRAGWQEVLDAAGSRVDQVVFELRLASADDAIQVANRSVTSVELERRDNAPVLDRDNTGCTVERNRDEHHVRIRSKKWRIRVATVALPSSRTGRP